MKISKTLICTTLLLSTLLANQAAYSMDIRGLNKKQKKDATRCIRMLFRTDFNHMNNQPNNLVEVERYPEVAGIVMHNFVHPIYFENSSIERSVIISGSLLTGKNRLSLKNTVLANVTLAGDTRKVDFTGACLINVSLPTATSWFEYRRIRKQVKFYKNIEFDDNIYKNY